MSISMTLNVPYRGPTATQTAVTIIEFEASAIAADAAVSVDGVAVPVAAPGCAGAACTNADLTPAGDDIQVTRLPSATRVRLTLTLFGSFSAGLCSSPTIGATGRSFSLTLTGFTFAGATTGYRITSLMAPSDASCDIPYVRVPSPKPFLVVNAGGPVTLLGRLPLSLVLVLDKSGSMGWNLPGTGVVRWDRLKQAVNLFAAVWDVVGAPPPPASVSSEGHPEDRLGVVFFNEAPSEFNLGPGTFFQTRGGLPAPFSGAVTAALNSTGPGGWTSIGAGIEQGRLRLNDVAALTGDTAIVLLTDGEQNRSPCVLHAGEVPVSHCTVAAGAGAAAQLILHGSAVSPPAPSPRLLIREVLPRGPIFTIGLGEGGMAASALLLDEIARESAGTPWFPNNGPALDVSFVDSLVTLLKGGTVSQLARGLGVLSAGAPAASPLTVAVDESLTRLVCVLGWEGRGRELDILVRGPDGQPVTPNLRLAGAQSVVVGLDLPAAGPAGDWQVQVIGTGGGAIPTAVAAPVQVDFHLTVLGVESRLSFRVSESPRLGTDRPLEIVAELGWDSAGLADLPDGAVRARIERPGENLGTILHDTPTPGIDPIADQSALMAKLGTLMAKDGLAARIAPQPAGTIALRSVGYGRYQGAFDGVNLGGQYRILVDLDWTDPRTGRIRRQQYTERQAAVVPTAQGSQVKVQPARDGRDAAIVVTPRDRFGNYVGPGFAGALAVSVDGTLVPMPPDADPALTGAYTIPLPGVGPGGNPHITIRYRGGLLRDAPLARVERPGQGPWGLDWLAGLRWWQLLLLLLLLLLALVVLGLLAG